MWSCFWLSCHAQQRASARHSFTAVLLLPFSMFPDSESQLHHPHFKPLPDKNSTFSFSLVNCMAMGHFVQDSECLTVSSYSFFSPPFFLLLLLFCPVFPKILWLYASVSLGRNILMLICSQCGFENIPGVVFDSSSSPRGVVAGIVSAAELRQNRRKS